MDSKGFVKQLERFVRDVSDDNSNWNGDYRQINEYDSSFAKEFEKYLNEGTQNTYSDKYFARQFAEYFADDNYQVEEYCPDIEKEMNKLWKEFGGAKVSKNNSNEGSNEGLASRMLSTALNDGAEVATRIAAKQLARSVAEPVTAMLIAGLDLQDNESTRGKIAKFLTSDVGLGLVSFALSFGVEQLPLPALAQATIKNLGRELRVQGEMAIADPVVEMVGAPLRMMLTEKVLALPIPGLSDARQLTQGPAKAIPQVIDAEVEVIEVAPKKKTTKTKKPTKKPAKKSTKKPVKKSNSATEIKVTVKDSSKSDSVN
ncbi:MAG TPA: hypothetical protein VM577_14820 [Anaerovoracaceae bacterium]|nr:hypothetical protein [Anaerovoracaceae bacterium]